MQKDNKSWHNFLSLDVVKSRFEVGPVQHNYCNPQATLYSWIVWLSQR